MSKVRSKETGIEKDFRKYLWAQGIRYRKNNSKYFGKPDITIASRKIAIFIDSCFWHGCKEHLKLPSSNKNFWSEKISKNIFRDEQVNQYYKDKGWIIIRIWEHDIKNEKVLSRVMIKIKTK